MLCIDACFKSQSTILQSHQDTSRREGERKEEWDRLKGPYTHLNLPKVKQILSLSCLQAKYDRTISEICSRQRTTPPPKVSALIGYLVVFLIFTWIIIEHYVSKQCISLSHTTLCGVWFFFVWFDSLRPSQQSFSYIQTGFPGLNLC